MAHTLSKQRLGFNGGATSHARHLLYVGRGPQVFEEEVSFRCVTASGDPGRDASSTRPKSTDWTHKFTAERNKPGGVRVRPESDRSPTGVHSERVVGR